MNCASHGSPVFSWVQGVLNRAMHLISTSGKEDVVKGSPHLKKEKQGSGLSLCARGGVCGRSLPKALHINDARSRPHVSLHCRGAQHPL